METDETATPTEDVLRAVSRALRGDRKGARVLVAKARNGIEARLQHDLGALWRNDAPTTDKPKIRGARLSPPQGLPPVSSLGAVEIRWPDGRKGRLVLTPAAARHRDMLVFMRVNEANMERAFDAIAHNGRAIDQLASSQRELADRLAKLQSSGDLALLRGIVEGLADLDRRVEGVKRLQNQALAAQKRSFQQRLSRQTRALASETRAAQLQKVHGAIASVQSAAFGTEGSLLAPNNIWLAVNQLGWSFLPEVIEALGLAKSGASSPLAWLAPLGSLVTSQAILGSLQRDVKPPPPPA